jgi:hypothetical protein
MEDSLNKTFNQFFGGVPKEGTAEYDAWRAEMLHQANVARRAEQAAYEAEIASETEREEASGNRVVKESELKALGCTQTYWLDDDDERHWFWCGPDGKELKRIGRRYVVAAPSAAAADTNVVHASAAGTQFVIRRTRDGQPVPGAAGRIDRAATREEAEKKLAFKIECNPGMAGKVAIFEE